MKGLQTLIHKQITIVKVKPSGLRTIIFILIWLVSSVSGGLFAQVTVSGSNLADGNYSQLRLAFNAINAQGNQAGRTITITITANTTETATAVLNQPTTATWTSLTIVPSGVRTISGSFSTPLIDLNGADNVIIDGLNTGGNSLTIRNSSTSTIASTSTLRFINDAANNIVRNNTIEGAAGGGSGGIILFGTGTTTGNDNNQILDNIITSVGTSVPRNAIRSAGTSVAVDNSNITISGNRISNYFRPGNSSNGIQIASNSSAWTIHNNRFFQTATRTSSAGVTHRAINIITASGVNYRITNNIIGFANAGGTGTTTYAGTVTHTFRAIEVNVGTADTTFVSGNTIAGISFTTSSGVTTLPGIFSGISVIAGRVEIVNNTIGSTTAASSITITSTTSLGVITGIRATSALPVTIQNNRIGGIGTGGTATIGYTFHGIITTGAGNHIVRSNLVGSTTLSNSISIGISGTTTAVCTFNAINNTATTGITIDQNTVQNVSVFGTGTSVFNGILNSGTTGIVTIADNHIIAVNNTGTGALTAISNTVAASQLHITNNTIRNLNKTVTGGAVTGISNTGAVTSAININGNRLGSLDGGFITFTAAHTAALIGISNTAGTATCSLTIQNNDIRGITYNVAGSSPHTYIINSAATLIQNIIGNSFTNLSVNTSGAIIFISNSVAIPANGTQNINENRIVGPFVRTATSGALTLFTNTIAIANTGVTINQNNNNFSNITVSGTATILGWINTDIGTGLANKTIEGNVFNIWRAGSGAVTAINVSTESTNNRTRNNRISNISTAGSITGITTAAGNDNISLNTIDSLSSTGGTTTTVIGIAVSGGTVKNIRNNTISRLTGVSLTTGAVHGINLTGGGINYVVQNTILTLQANTLTDGTLNGIGISGGTTFELLQNKIYNLSSSSSGITGIGAINGIYVSGAVASKSVLTANNLIGDLRATAASGTNLIRGVAITNTGTTSTINLFHNTIFLSAPTTTGANLGTSGVFHTASTATTTATLDMRNNIIVNISEFKGTGTTVAFRRSAGTAGMLANYASTSNNNLFFAGTPGPSRLIYADGISSAQTIAQYKTGVFTAGTIAPRDTRSVYENPNWTSTVGNNDNFLNINPAIATQIESGGAIVAAITIDFAGNIRHGNVGYIGAGFAPDIGAFEFEGISFTDYQLFILYPLLGNAGCTTGRELQAQIFGGLGINTTPGLRPRIYFKKTTDNNVLPATNNNTTNGWKWTEATNTSSPFNFVIDYNLLFGGAPPGSVIQYFIVAQDNQVPPLIATNNAIFSIAPTSVALTASAFPATGIINSFTVLNGLSGTVRVGSGEAYTTLTGIGGLFDAINTNGIAGNLVATITTNITEPGTISLNAIALNCGTGDIAITIMPQGARLINGTVNGGPLINLNGVNNVIIDGLNTGGNSLTISNLSTAATAGTSTIRFIGGASNNIIRNAIIEGSGTGVATATIYFSTGLFTDNDHNTITNSVIRAVGTNLPTNAIRSAGTSVAIDNNNNHITNNHIQDYFNPTINSNGVFIESNSSEWTISGNRFFQTGTRTSTGAFTHRAIHIVTESGVGYHITNNIIGFANAAGTGVTTYSGAVAHLFRAIEMTVGIASASSVQGNTISGISFSTSSNTTALPGVFSGISVLEGAVSIGDITPNTIGAATGTGSINITSTASGGVFTGIHVTSESDARIRGNIIGSISTSGGAAIGFTFHGISTTGTGGNFLISGNRMGSSITPHSIAVGTLGTTTTGVCIFNGIHQTATGITTITDNIIHNTSVFGTAASIFRGIYNTEGVGVLTIEDNSIIGGTSTGTGAFTAITSTAAAHIVNINRNIIRNHEIRGPTTPFTGILQSGTVVENINIANNQLGNVSGGLVSYTVANSGAHHGIANTAGGALAGLNITGNDFRGIMHSVAGSSAHTYIINSAATLTQNISQNTFTNLAVNTTGSITFIANSVAIPATGIQNVNNNSIVGSFSKTGAGGILTLFTSTAPSISGGVVNNNNNNFSNITVLGGTAIAGWVNTDAGSATKTIRGNTFSNWIAGTGTITALDVGIAGVDNTVSENQIHNLSGGAGITGISSDAGNDNISQNIIHTLISTGTGATIVNGIAITAGTVKNIFQNTIHNLQGNLLTTGSVNGINITGGINTDVEQNTIHTLQANALTSGSLNGIAVLAGSIVNLSRCKIYNLSSSSAGITGAINGILVSGFAASLNVTVINNIIGDLRATAASGTNLIRGVGLTSTGTTSSINLYYNTIFLSAPTTTGANLGTSGVFHTASTTATTSRLDMRNNIIVNISESKGTGTTVAFRRSAGGANMLNNYAPTSNNNLFFAGTPGPSRLIYADGTSSAQTITAFIAGAFIAGTIAPRDDQSITENPNFLSILGNSPNFLKVNPAWLTFIESGGTPIDGIHDDFEGDIRSESLGFPPQQNRHGQFPDIGADEFDGSRPIETTIAGSKGWRMIASPTQTTYAQLLGSFVTQGFTGATAPLRQPNLNWFDETDAGTTNMSWRTISNINNPIVPGKGHYFYVFGHIPSDPLYTNVLPINMNAIGLKNFTDGTFSFSGTNHRVTFTPRTINQTGPGTFLDINLADEGWNLLGNPTLHSLNWDAAGWTKTNMDNVIYIWDPHISQWRTWNGITGNLGNGLIAPFQAFWVRANAANPVLSFNQNVLADGGFFFGGAVKEAEANEDITIRIGGSFNEVNSQIFISFSDDGRVGPDRLDAYRLEPLNESYLAMFTLSSSSHQMPLVINSLPIEAPDVIRLPLYLGGQTNRNPINGPVALTWEIPQNWPSQWSITLHDHQNQTVVDMKANNSYRVAVSGLRSTTITNSEANSNMVLPYALIHPVSTSSMLKSGTTPPPLSIVINKNASANDMEYVALTPKLFPAFPNPFTHFTYINFSLPEQMPVRIDVFDIQGRLIETVANETFAAGHNTIRWSPQHATARAFYLIRLTSNISVETTRVLRINH